MNVLLAFRILPLIFLYTTAMTKMFATKDANIANAKHVVKPIFRFSSIHHRR